MSFWVYCSAPVQWRPCCTLLEYLTLEFGELCVLTVYPKKYAHGFCFAMLCCGYTLTDFPISIRLTSLALWQSNDCPSASKATLMNMDKYFMWIHYERLHNHNKAKHNKTVCIFLGIYCNAGHLSVTTDCFYPQSWRNSDYRMWEMNLNKFYSVTVYYDTKSPRQPRKCCLVNRIYIPRNMYTVHILCFFMDDFSHIIQDSHNGTWELYNRTYT